MARARLHSGLIRTIVWAIVAFGAAPLWAGPFSLGDDGRLTQPHPAVCRIVVPEGDGMSLGSGTLVGASDFHGLVITNWHVIRDNRGSIMVAFPDGFRSSARLLHADKDWDLAALAIWKPSVAAVPLAAGMPQRGDVLTIAGYGSGAYREATGRMEQYASPANHLPFEMIEVTTSARQGDSGGPIFNQRGEVAGVLFGSASGRTTGSYSGRVRAFLLPLLDDFVKLQPPPQTMLAGAPPATPPTYTADTTRPPANAPSAAPPARAIPAPPGNVAVRAPTATGPASQYDEQPVPPARPTAAVPRSPPAAADVAARAPSAPPMAEPVNRPQEPAYIPAGETASIVGPTAPMEATETAPGFSWKDLAGATHGEQAKTVLAAIGGVAIALHLVSFVGALREKPKPKRKPKPRVAKKPAIRKAA